MSETLFRNRRAVQLENAFVRLTVLAEGGHIAEILDKKTGINPLWTPPWPSIEPSRYDPREHPQYGSDAESRLLAGIMGHNLCLDLFGGPSAEEAAAGLTVHGESSVAAYQMHIADGELTASATLPLAGLRVERRLRLDDDTVLITETVENLTALDRPLAWTQHVTLGPPFLERGQTRFHLPATLSRTYEESFGDLYQPAADFVWPEAPRLGGGTLDLRTYTSAPKSAGFTTHLMNPERPDAFFLAWSPAEKLLFGYQWQRADFPWLGIWVENHVRENAPWNGNTMTCGMEFGASPMPESRRSMIQRGNLFGVPAYRWLPAKAKARVEYSAFVRPAESLPDAP